MSETPDRDEARQKLAQALVDLDNMQDQRDLAMKMISRLERERNEAREEMANALQEVDLRLLDFERMKQERDGAQEKYATEATEHMLAVNKLCGERDAARAALMRIEDLFVDGTDIYADRENMGLIAREALENE